MLRWLDTFTGEPLLVAETEAAFIEAKAGAIDGAAPRFLDGPPGACLTTREHLTPGVTWMRGGKVVAVTWGGSRGPIGATRLDPVPEPQGGDGA